MPGAGASPGAPQAAAWGRALAGLIFRPGRFYEDLQASGGWGRALVFLLASGALFSALASPGLMQGRPVFSLIYFVNAVMMPLVTALLLYGGSLVLCKGAYTLGGLCRITAYANVTLLAAWIPGLAGVAGIWRFYLIGVGLVKAGRVAAWRAALLLAAAAGVLLLLIGLARPVLTGA